MLCLNGRLGLWGAEGPRKVRTTQDARHLTHSALGRVFGVGLFFILLSLSFIFLFFFNVSSRKKLNLSRLYMTLAGVTVGLRH